MSIKRLIDAVEKLFLALIACFTVVAMGQEIWVLVENRRVALQDLLLMFIYAEVLGMLGAFYVRHLAPVHCDDSAEPPDCVAGQGFRPDCFAVRGGRHFADCGGLLDHQSDAYR